MRVSVALLLILPLLAGQAPAGDEFENPPIEYSRSTPDNAVSRLNAQLECGDVDLKFEERHGYLPSLLQALRVSEKSQMLVFSKTSLQRSRIDSRTPRALYFNDDVYVGYCHAGDVLEVSVADPVLGAVFYTLEQTEIARPGLKRQADNCMLCHSSRGEVPSHLVRSVFAESSGLPVLGEGTYRVDHTTPLENRWGGWYVTGTHGDQPHLGNFLVRSTPVKRPVENAAGMNVVDVNLCRDPLSGW